MEKILLTIREAGEAIGIGKSKMYELIREGEIPILRIGRAVRIPAADLRLWVSRQLQRDDDLS